MQGPKLKVVAECGDCEFLNYNKDYFICEKLSTGCTWTLDKLENNPIASLECPFLEKSLVAYKNNYISEINNSHSIRIKNIIKTIFSKNDYEFNYEEFSLTYKIISNGTDVVIELIKENKHD